MNKTNKTEMVLAQLFGLFSREGLPKFEKEPSFAAQLAKAKSANDMAGLIGLKPILGRSGLRAGY